MYCNSCGKVIVGVGRFCTNCGVAVSGISSSLKEVDTLKNEDNLIGSRLLNKISKEEAVIKDVQVLDSLLINKNQYVETDEDITIREKVKRISEERIRREVEITRLQNKVPIPVEEFRHKIEQTIEPRIVGENVNTDKSKLLASKRKSSLANRILVTAGSYILGISVFIMCMGYLFWRFAPPGNSYKNEFAQWMQTNTNGKVNQFFFVDMNLNDYYSPAKNIDYSGTYVSRKSASINNIYLTYKENQLTGYYILDGREYKLKGYIKEKGSLLLLESLDGIPTATITGTLFSVGYLTAERNEQGTGKKEILSMEKMTNL